MNARRIVATVALLIAVVAMVVQWFPAPAPPEAPPAPRPDKRTITTPVVRDPEPAPPAPEPEPLTPPRPRTGRSVTVELSDAPAERYLSAPSTENDAFYRSIVQSEAGGRAQYDVDLGLAAREFVFQSSEFRDEAPADVRDFLTRAVGALASDTTFQHVRTTSEAERALRQAVAAVLAAPPSGSGPLHIGVGEIYTPGAELPRHIGVVGTRLPIAMEPASRSAALGSVWTVRGRLRAPWRDLQALVLKPDGRIVSQMPKIQGDAIEVRVEVGTVPGTVEMQLIGKGPEGPGKLVQMAVEVGQPLPRSYTTRLAPSEKQLQTADDAAAYALQLLNADRARAGVAALRWDAELARIARDHSADMRDHGFFAHLSPTTGLPTDRLTAARYRATASSENLAHNATIFEAEAGLLHSLGHRRNLLDPQMRAVGIGIAGKDDDNGRRSWWVTQLFARPVDDLDVRAEIQRVRDAIAQKRSVTQLGELEPDAQLDAAAEAAAREVLQGQTEDGSAAALAQVRSRGLLRGRIRAWAAQASELEGLRLPESVTSPSARRLGIAVVPDPKSLSGLCAVVLLVAD